MFLFNIRPYSANQIHWELCRSPVFLPLSLFYADVDVVPWIYFPGLPDCRIYLLKRKKSILKGILLRN